MNKPQIIYGLAADHAHTRDANQDASTAVIMNGVSDAGPLDVGLFIVADGTAGAHDSESAPVVAIRTVVNEVVRQLHEPLMANMGNYDAAPRGILVDAFHAAHQRLLEHPAYGTTSMTAALVNAGVAYIAHVGDTSAHAMTPNGVNGLTTMHNLAHKLVENGEVTWEQINHNQVDVTNVLYRSLGKNEALDIDVVTYPIEPDSPLLLCSKGLSGWNWEQITQYDVNSIMLSAYDLQYACNRLVSLAQERKSIDAVTAILIGSGGA